MRSRSEKVILQTTKSYVSTSEGNKLLVCIGYDITKAVEKEIKLKNAIKVEQEAHQMMRAIFHELPSAILIKDIEDDYRFYIINKKFEQMCNLPKELLIAKPTMRYSLKMKPTNTGEMTRKPPGTPKMLH